jgi:hypothetical protein
MARFVQPGDIIAADQGKSGTRCRLAAMWV